MDAGTRYRTNITLFPKGGYPLDASTHYYFGFRDASGRVQLIPGLGSDLSSEPYHVVR
jgi:hypothetical protein